MLNKYSVVFSGTQGSGKTTLTQAWATHAGVEYKAVETRKYTPAGVSSHMDILKLSVNAPDVAIKFQSDLIRKRFELFSKLYEEGVGFTSDRAVIDSYIYYLMHNAVFDGTQNNLSNNALTIASVGLYDLTVILNPKIAEATDDNFRISNPFYYAAYADVHKSTTLRIYDSIFSNSDNIMNYSNQCLVTLEGFERRGSVKMHVARTANGRKRGFVILDEPDGMIPTNHRVSLIEKAVEAFDKM